MDLSAATEASALRKSNLESCGVEDHRQSRFQMKLIETPLRDTLLPDASLGTE